MGNWIFVMKGSHEEFAKRVSSGKWPINRLTHHRNRLTYGDNIVFYIGGKGNKNFIGDAKLVSKIKHEFSGSDYSVRIEKFSPFTSPLPIKDVIHGLDFIKNKGNWGITFKEV